VDVLINISKEALDTFRKKPKRSTTIMNFVTDFHVKEEESDLHHVLKVVYTGAIWRKSRGLENLIATIKDVKDVEFVIAG
jgi:hypothetical protein